MKDKTYLIDSNIIIYHLNSEPLATRFLQQNIMQSAISRLTFLEVLSFDFTKKEEQKTLRLLDKFTILDTSREIALKAISNRKNRRIK